MRTMFTRLISNYLAPLCRANVNRALLAILVIVADAGPLWAQAKPAVEPAAKSYTMAYMVVVLLIALGLMIVLRGGGRSNEPKLPDLE